MSRRAPRALMTVTITIGIAAFGAGCAANTAVIPRPQPFPGAPGFTSRPQQGATSLTGVLASAVALAGEPYVYGGADPATGFDCSGLVWYAFFLHHIALPRTTAAQYDFGRPVDQADIEPGDLVFFATTAPGPSHVGLALDAHTLVHAPSTGTSVRIERFDTPYWQSRLLGIRRVDAAGVPSAAARVN